MTHAGPTMVTVVGGGLAGCEAALQLVRFGIRVRLVEMRPEVRTPAHRGDGLAEIVCSNSLKSTAPATASGLLKEELDLLGCRLLSCAREASVPAGAALAVDREEFSCKVAARISAEPLIEVSRVEITQLPLRQDEHWLVASGPLTSPDLSLSSLLRRHRSHGDAGIPRPGYPLPRRPLRQGRGRLSQCRPERGRIRDLPDFNAGSRKSGYPGIRPERVVRRLPAHRGNCGLGAEIPGLRSAASRGTA